jgi:Alpha-L-arabinofuranosidase B (ABFB) domain
MNDPGAASPEDGDEGVDGLLRPHVTGSGDNTSGSGSARDTAPLPAHVLVPAQVPAGRRRPGDTGGRHRSRHTASPRKWFLALTFYRLLVAIAAAVAIAAFAGGVFLFMLPNHSTTTLASKCQPSSCRQGAPRSPGTVLPVTVPASASDYPVATPSANWAVTAQATGGQAAALPTATVTAASSATATAAPSVTATAASPSPSTASTAPGLTPGSRISIQATTACCTSFYIQHDDSDNRVVITQLTPGSSATADADATWIVQAGLADGSCVSFESANDPGEYLRHYDFELYLDPDDGSSQFASDATFCPQPGNSGQGYSFQSVNYPNMYIRHYDYVVYLASDGGPNPWDTSTLWPDDTTWLVSQPWG